MRSLFFVRSKEAGGGIRLYPSKIKYQTKNLEFTNRASLIGFNKRANVNLFNNKYSFAVLLFGVRSIRSMLLAKEKEKEPKHILNCLSRFESGLTPSNKDYRPNTIALEHINKGNAITSQVINSVLLNQKVSITQQELGLRRAFISS